MDEELGLLGRDAFTDALQLESLRTAEGGTPLSLVAVGIPPDASGGRAAAAAVPRLLGGADALLALLEEELAGFGVVQPASR